MLTLHKCIEAHNDGLASWDGDAATADGLVGEQFGGREIPRQGKQVIAPAAIHGHDTAVALRPEQLDALTAELLRDLRQAIIELDTARTQALIGQVTERDASVWPVFHVDDLELLVPGPASASTALISGKPPAMTADGTSTAILAVQARDANSNNLVASGSTVILATTAGSLGSVTDHNKGTYTAILPAPTNLGTISGTTIGDTAPVHFTHTRDHSSSPALHWRPPARAVPGMPFPAEATACSPVPTWQLGYKRR